MEPKKTFTIEATEKQVRTLANACEFYMRCIIGQLDGDFSLLCNEHYRRNHPDATEEELDSAYDKIETHAMELAELCWNKGDGSYHGLKYDNTADLLYEMRKSLEYGLFKSMPEEKQIALRFTNMSSPSIVQYTDEPFLEVEEKKES